eukprot:5662-Heterococcus_DN1.PRE.4
MSDSVDVQQPTQQCQTRTCSLTLSSAAAPTVQALWSSKYDDNSACLLRVHLCSDCTALKGIVAIERVRTKCRCSETAGSAARTVLLAAHTIIASVIGSLTTNLTVPASAKPLSYSCMLQCKHCFYQSNGSAKESQKLHKSVIL